MYISRELFEATCPPTQHRNPTSAIVMPTTNNNVLGKRRRSPEDEIFRDEISLQDKPVPPPPSVDNMVLDSVVHNPNFHFIPSPDRFCRSRIQNPSLDSQPPPSRRRRINISDKLLALKQNKAQTADIRTSPPTTPALPVNLEPCHHCHKAPKQNKDLENYTDCQLCNERTCFICLRLCECERKICSDCSVEEGAEGDVHCMKCYVRQDDGDGEGMET